jgi:hypothetical protein
MRHAVISVGLMLAVVPVAFAEGGFTGTWQTTYGRMSLTQKGDKVAGHYETGGVRNSIEGKVEKNKFTFTYEEPGASGEGWFELASDGKSFAGKWRENGMAEWAPWAGKRVSAAVAAEAPPGFAGLWRTQFGRVRLVQDGKNISGCYDYTGGATIAGTLEGNKLTFAYKEPQAEGEGWFELAADGKSFKGKWKPKSASRWQTWDGSRIDPQPGVVWLVVVEARWESNLAEQEYAFGNMLRAFFSRAPRVQVRHRFFTDEASLRRWCGEVAYLAEPTVLVIASHGSAKGPQADGKTVPARALGESLRYASNLKLLHFSACEVMKGKAGEELLSTVNKANRFPVSGYKVCVDWAASAIIEFGYLDMVLVRGMTPAAAAEQIGRLMPFSKDQGVPGSVFGQASFRLLKPEDVK